MKIFASSDHAGFALRRALVDHLRKSGHDVVDLGPKTDARTDYPDHAWPVTRAVLAEPGSLGLLVCGSGVGMSIAANRVHGIRAVNAWAPDVARVAREHNDANVLCIGERVIAASDAPAIVDAFLGGRFSGGRHTDRIAKLDRDDGQGGVR